MAGVGEDSIRWASVNSLGEVNCNEVEDCVLRDKRDGCLPVGIVANFGTTAEGAIDDYTRLADIAKRFEMWLHIDAAWGGGALVAGALSIATLDFDSISIDAHKMLMSPIGAGIFLSRRPELLNKAFGVGVRYELAHPNGNLFDNSPQWSRRFIGARVFAALASVGREGLRARITHHTVLARQLRDGLVKGGWKVINDSLLPIVCFKMSNAPDSQDDLIRAIFDLVTSETDFAITHTRGADGHLMLRAAICSSGTEERDIDDLVTELNRIKTKVQRGRDEAPV
jgi:glutamate/tyrosine decarboxylase-like PLP-dependent enzyme